MFLINTNNVPGRIYVKFDDPDAGNKLKDRRLVGELKEYVPITPVCTEFLYQRNGKDITAQRKQFPLIIGHAITIHKSQSSIFF